jgi:hypothetical protein
MADEEFRRSVANTLESLHAQRSDHAELLRELNAHQEQLSIVLKTLCDAMAVIGRKIDRLESREP